MILKDINKRIIITAFVVIAIAIAFVRVTYATFTVYQVTDTETITFDKIGMTVCPNNICESIGNIIGTYDKGDGTKGFVPFYPVSDPTVASFPSGWSNLNPYVFTLENTGDLDLITTIYLEPDTTATNEYASLNVNNGVQTSTQTFTGFVDSTYYKYFKVAIVENGTSGTLTSANVFTFDQITGNADPNKLISLTLSKGETKTFYLYMWLSDEAISTSPTGSNNILGKYLVTQISAKGEYLPTTNSVKIIASNGTASENRVIPSEGSATVTLTPNSGYYLASASCTNGYTTNATTGISATNAQEVTISTNSNTGGSTCTFTYAETE